MKDENSSNIAETITKKASDLSKKASSISEKISVGFLSVLFIDPKNAEEAYNGLLKRGYKEEDITLMMSDETKKKHFPSNTSSDHSSSHKALKGMGVGSALGGVVGAIAAAIAAAAGSTIVVPGLGIVIAGSLASGLAGAGAGAAAGGIVGALVGAGIDEIDANKYESGIKKGGVVIGVNPLNADDYKSINEEWEALQG